jgi:uncharacterized membrane protein YgcG
VLTIAQLAPIRDKDPYLYETLTNMVNEVNGLHTQTGSANGAPVAAPPTIQAISVSAANGFFTITINDPAGLAQMNLGLHYFLEWDVNPNFPNPTSEDISASRGEYIYLGNLTTYWRAKSQFRNSPMSSPYVYFGTQQNPTAVAGGGAAGGAPAGGGSGSGGGGGGFGGGGGRQGGGLRSNLF